MSPEPRPPSRRPAAKARERGESGAFPPTPPASARSRRSEAETVARREGRPPSRRSGALACREGGRGERRYGVGPTCSFVPDGTRFLFAPQPTDESLYLFAVGGSARASRAMFGALAEHTFRSARAPTGAAEAAALPEAKHIRIAGLFSSVPVGSGLTTRKITKRKLTNPRRTSS